MNKEEIRKALEIIREPITVNCKDYHYFDNENYIKLLNVYENCLWFINNFEQINDVVERLEQENKELKEQLENASNNYTKYIQERDNKIEKAIEYIENNTYSSVSNMKTTLYLQNDELYDLLEILKDSDVDE